MVFPLGALLAVAGGHLGQRHLNTQARDRERQRQERMVADLMNQIKWNDPTTNPALKGISSVLRTNPAFVEDPRIMSALASSLMPMAPERPEYDYKQLDDGRFIGLNPNDPTDIHYIGEAGEPERNLKRYTGAEGDVHLYDESTGEYFGALPGTTGWRPSTSVTVNTGDQAPPHPLLGDRASTPAETEYDKQFVKEGGADYLSTQYGQDQTAYTRVDDIVRALESGEFGDPTGPAKARISKLTGGLVYPEQERIKSAVHSAIGGSLRTLSGQTTGSFTDADADLALNIAFDPASTVEDNVRRLKDVSRRMKYNSEVAKEQNLYFKENGTLIGFNKQFQTLEDLDPHDLKPLEQNPIVESVTGALSSVGERFMPQGQSQGRIQDRPSTPPDPLGVRQMTDDQVESLVSQMSDEELSLMAKDNPETLEALLSRLEAANAN